MVKTAVLLGLMTSLVGGFAPRLIEANGTINVIAKGQATANFGLGEAEAKPNIKKSAAGKPMTATKKYTKAGITKGKTMTTTDSRKKGVGKVSSLPGGVMPPIEAGP